MYKLTVESGFSAAHRLVNYPGACSNLHGHNWKVKLTISATELDDTGMVIDLMELKNYLDECLQQFDHHLINEVEPFDVTNPTSENLARYIYQWIRDRLPEKIGIETVQVLETEDFAVSYCAD